MTENICTASIIMAAGRGSRMKTYDGNKTLLPLVPGKSPFKGTQPILLHILKSLPFGPKAVIVNYKKEDIKNATKELDLTYCCQPKLNGTGGALLAAREFLEKQTCEYILITMGDVPFVRPETYIKLLQKLDNHHLAVLGFKPENKNKYGVLEIKENNVERIIEWKYWKDFPEPKIALLTICNSGIYAARLKDMLKYLSILESRPQIVHKERNGKMVPIQEYFITDLVEFMYSDGLSIGFVITDNEMETMGIDDPEALERAQNFFKDLSY